MSLRSALPVVFDFLVVETSDAEISSDEGLTAIRQFGERIGFTRETAVVLADERDPRLIAHSMLSQRINGILADYEDQDDHEVLLPEPVFEIISGLHS